MAAREVTSSRTLAGHAACSGGNRKGPHHRRPVSSGRHCPGVEGHPATSVKSAYSHTTVRRPRDSRPFLQHSRTGSVWLCADGQCGLGWEKSRYRQAIWVGALDTHTPQLSKHHNHLPSSLGHSETPAQSSHTRSDSGASTRGSARSGRCSWAVGEGREGTFMNTAARVLPPAQPCSISPSFC